MYVPLERAWIDAVKIHDVADLTGSRQLRSAKRQVAPRRDSRPRSSRHGENDVTRFYGGQVWDLAGYVDGNTDAGTAAAWDELAAALGDLDTWHTFRFKRRGWTDEEQLLAKLAALDAPTEGYAPQARYALTLAAPDPRVYSATIRSGTYDPTGSIAGGGATVPLTFPIAFAFTVGAYLELVNAGSFRTPPVFTITGPIGNPLLQNIDTGEQLQLVYQLGAGETIRVDVDARRVELNGALRRDLVDAGASTWWQLARGTNRVRLSGTGMVAAQTRLDATFRDARVL